MSYDYIERLIASDDYKPESMMPFEESILDKLHRDIKLSEFGSERWIRSLFGMRSDLHEQNEVISEENSKNVRRIVFFAHGSYGMAFKAVSSINTYWSELIESNPVHFYYNILYAYLVRTIHLLSSLVKSSPRNIVLVPNVEYGLQSVLNSITSDLLFRTDNASSDEIVNCVIPIGSTWLLFDFTYEAVLQSIRFYGSRRRVKVTIIVTTWPMTKESIVNDFQSAIAAAESEGETVSLACFEHVTSPTGIVLPITSLVALCKKHSVLSLIDGAHGIGQLDLDLDQWQPDFYASNCHKWLCSARGCAILYVNPLHQSYIHPLVISWGRGKGWHSEFIWQGTMDYAPMLSAYTAGSIFNLLDYKRVIAYNNSRVIEFGKVLRDIWQTSTLVNEEELIGAMVSVQIPKALRRKLCSDIDTCSFSDLHEDLINKYNIEIPIYSFRGLRYCRLSIHLYNTAEQVLELARAVLVIQGYEDSDEAYRILQAYESLTRQSNET